MSNSWLRLWHDMPNDPKWKTISRVSGEPIPFVISVYVHLLVTASQSDPRGTAHLSPEDIASALDIDTENVLRILDAMQNRVMDGERITGWEKRQPNREDNSSDRTKNWRNRQKSVTLRHKESQVNSDAPYAKETQCDEEPNEKPTNSMRYKI